ncbi:MAG TPA: acyl--CoA ligase, partial [Labilithrix sp.]|nr:acyl--CoA ligase [Labilithrix sp.]
SAPGRRPATYGDIGRVMEQTHALLRKAGIGRTDRVAIVLPNGPEIASCFVAVASAAACAPLNPAYTADELDYYLADLRPRAIVLSRTDCAARQVAKKRGLAIFTLDVGPEFPAGVFRLEAETPFAGTTSTDGPLGADDVALLLHTSGTTSRPKLVPLTSGNLCASARNIKTTLGLEESDVCLNVMPLFHIHGLVASLLASFDAGASVTSTPGFDALQFFGWLKTENPSWYSAVPTMHQAVLARAPRNIAIVRESRLRFVRSSSASLSPQVMRELEETFGCPVIEAYGMTEASHQMTSNPLPPRPRKPGCVGLQTGTEVAIMSDDGRRLLDDAEGEVVVRGPSVTRGYLDAPDANEMAFKDGWFRTGDRGRLDSDGYLRLTGRIKEIINRGGEKISPLEVDAVLMDHAAVAQAVTFGVPHPKLGEEVAAVVVVREGRATSERELKAHAAKRLANFKVPRTIVFVTDIPKGPTGKVQRVGLAKRLGVNS